MAARDDFKRGCESGGGSFVENPDGSYQCNTTSGLVIKCQRNGQRCWVAAEIADGLHINLANGVLVRSGGLRSEIADVDDPSPT